VSLKGEAIILVTIPRFDVALRDTTAPRLWKTKLGLGNQIVQKVKGMGIFALQRKTKK
jgi:hypothetical protein